VSTDSTRVVLRPIANPFALGFVGLAGASVSAAGLEVGWVEASQRHQVGLIVLVFGAGLQTIGCVFGFLSRDAVAATGLGLLAGTWASIGLVLLTTPPGSTSGALGTLLLFAATACLIAVAIAAQRMLVPALVLFGTSARFLITGIHELGGGGGWKPAGGYVGLVLGFLALYAAASLELEDERHHPVLPTLRHGRGRRALNTSLPEQVQEVAAEAGVRQQL
jgi:succinate-acetate transporter protein